MLPYWSCLFTCFKSCRSKDVWNEDEEFPEENTLDALDAKDFRLDDILKSVNARYKGVPFDLDAIRAAGLDKAAGYGDEEPEEKPE